MANIKISELSPLLTVQDADVIPIVDNAITKKVTAEILRSYTQGNSVLLTGAQTVAGIKTFTAQLASSVATGTAPFSVASTTKVTNLNADLLDGLSSADFQATLSGTGIVKSTAGTISYLTDNTANWDAAYNDKINSAAVTGIGTNTLTLTQQDAGTITATWVNGTLIREIRNTTGATLTKGTIVYISGATGNKPTVTKAIATGDETSAQTFGFVQENIANNANGYVVIIGDLVGIDTSAYAEGAQLYLSSTTAGTFTDVKQYAPNHLVYVGIVTRAHPTLGQIEVNIQNGFEMDELHNVAAQNPSNGDILQYVTSTGLWTKIAGTTSAISEGSNLYFTNARSRSAFSESVTGLDYNSTTGVLSTTSGYGIPTTASQTTWDTAYNDSIVSAAVTGTTTKTLTLNQQDGGSVTASWTDDNTDAVSSVFGRTGAVVATSGDYTTTQVTEGTNLYFTDARSRNAISLTTTGTSGAATYNSTTGVLNVPNYADTDTGITSLNGLTALTQTFAVGTSGTDFGISSATSTHTFNLPTASATNRGALSSADWTTFNNKASTAALANYLPLAGGTLTGALNGTSAVFSGNLDINGNTLSLGSFNIVDSYLGYSSTYRVLVLSDQTANNNIGLNYNPITNAGSAFNGTGQIFIANNKGILASNSAGDNYIGVLKPIGTGVYFGGSLTSGDLTGNGLFISTAGNVGVNTNTPASKLQVEGSDYSFIAGSDAGNRRVLIGLDTIGEPSIQGTLSNGTARQISINPSGGNVLIGTTTDAGYKLDVNGTARVSGTSAEIRIQSTSINQNAELFFASTATTWRIGQNIGTATDFEIYNGGTLFKMNTSGAATFSSSVTAARGIFGGSTGETLTAQGTAGNWVANLSGSASTGNSYGLLVEAGTNSSDLALGIYSKSFAATLLTIKGDGVATFGGKVNIGNPVTAAVAVASTHKVEIVIGGTTYYLLATT